jgi:hypothetical protein
MMHICYDWELIDLLKNSHIKIISCIYSTESIIDEVGKISGISGKKFVKMCGYPISAESYGLGLGKGREVSKLGGVFTA